MSIILTISICFNVFQFIIFFFLVISYKETLNQTKKNIKEIDEITDMLKEKIFNDKNNKSDTV